MEGVALPPRVWRRLLKRLLPEGINDEVLQELDNRYRSRIEQGDPEGVVLRWYRGQVLRALVPALKAHYGREYSGNSVTGNRNSREDRRGAGLDGLKQDLRFAVVQLRRSPGHTLLVIITLGVCRTFGSLVIE